MKIAVWKTSHQIADTVANSLRLGLRAAGHNAFFNYTDELRFCTGTVDEARIHIADIHIGYGILRGMDEVFIAVEKVGKPWFEIDKGYWKPGHYDGYYRVSLNGTQQTTGLGKIKPDYERWDALGLGQSYQTDRDGPTLICPPTRHVHDFFELEERWTNNLKDGYSNAIVRNKDDIKPLQHDLSLCKCVYTFNSSVGWEALRQGIPVVSDPTHSIVGAYQKLIDKPLYLDYEARKRLFAIMSSLQLTLAEIKAGAIWPLIQNLLQST